MKFVDINQVDLDIDTMVINNIDYVRDNIHASLTNVGSKTWSGNFPNGLDAAGAQLLHFGSLYYRVQIFVASNGFAARITFGGWKPWTICTR